MTSRPAHASEPHAPSPTAMSEYTWAQVLTNLLARRHLSPAAASWATDQIVTGLATPVQTAGFLTALRAKGETVEEIAAIADTVRQRAVPVTVPGPTADIAGTGGDGGSVVNVSTIAAIVAAATGVRMLKHGGRAASSATAGAADLIEGLGIPLDLTPQQAQQVALEAGITFLFAPQFNPGLRHAGPVRRELGIPTVLNTIGPLLNPAAPTASVIGVADARAAPLVAQVLAAQGRQGLVARGHDGLDKLTTTTTSDVWVVHGGRVRAHVLDPRELGFASAAPETLHGGDPATNAVTTRAVLNGRTGAVRDIVILNAAAVLVALDPGSGSLADLKEAFAAAVVRCGAALDEGAAAATLNRWIGSAARAGDT